MRKLILAAALALSCAGCTTLPTDLITQTVQQVQTLDEAEQASTLAFNLVAAHPLSKAQFHTIRVDADAIQAQFHKLQADRDAGRPLVFVAINTAITLFNTARGAK
jgi:outer membrane murein-binding lipoprotein Lpp